MRRPLTHYLFDLLILAAVILLVAGCIALTWPRTGSAAPATDCAVKTWQGSPYAFCGKHTCATVTNTTNRITWMTRNRTGSTTYRDLDRIIPAKPLPLFARHAITSAFVAMHHGTAGPKTVTVCTD